MPQHIPSSRNSSVTPLEKEERRGSPLTVSFFRRLLESPGRGQDLNFGISNNRSGHHHHHSYYQKQMMPSVRNFTPFSRRDIILPGNSLNCEFPFSIVGSLPENASLSDCKPHTHTHIFDAWEFLWSYSWKKVCKIVSSMHIQ